MASVDDVLSFIKKQLGKTYVYGAAGPNTFDCSGLMQYAFHQYGIDLPRTSQEQAKQGTDVSYATLQPGDLVFSDWGDGPNSHVGIAVGNNQIIDAPHTGAVVRYDTLDSNYQEHITAIRRIINPGETPLQQAASAVSGGVDSIVTPLIKPLTDIASAAGEGAKLADLVAKMFLPTNIVRGFCLLGGAVFILLGILFLSREVRT